MNIKLSLNQINAIHELKQGSKGEVVISQQGASLIVDIIKSLNNNLDSLKSDNAELKKQYLNRLNEFDNLDGYYKELKKQHTELQVNCQRLNELLDDDKDKLKRRNLQIKDLKIRRIL